MRNIITLSVTHTLGCVVNVDEPLKYAICNKKRKEPAILFLKERDIFHTIRYVF